MAGSSKSLEQIVVVNTLHIIFISISLNDVTHEEVWSRRKLVVSHFGVFGFLCFKHILDKRRKKLDDKGQPMMFLGYDSTGAYKLYNPNSRKIVLSKDVVVDEIKGW
ncbi:hypothetical protein CR513_36691, partial [Mucuna pruriens]